MGFFMFNWLKNRKKLIIVAPHRIIAREVYRGDYRRILKDADKMEQMCNKRYSDLYPGAHALAHTQITDYDPLRFFVNSNGQIFMNPKIVRREDTIHVREGCVSFPNRPPKKLYRSRRIEVTYETLDDLKDVEQRTGWLSKQAAQVFQHEIDHLDGKYIYDGALTPAPHRSDLRDTGDGVSTSPLARGKSNVS